MTNQEWLLRAVKFDVGPPVALNGYIIPDNADNDFPHHYHYFIEARKQSDGRKKWVIKEGSLCMSKSQKDFVYEPSNSCRTEKFNEDTRFDDPDEALNFLEQWKKEQREILSKDPNFKIWKR